MMDSPDYNTIFALKTKQLAIMIIKEFSKLPPNEALFCDQKTNIPVFYFYGC